MPIAYLDCSSGISGDKLLGALVSAGAGLPEIQAALDTLETGARLTAGSAVRGGVAGTTIRVDGPPSPPQRRWADIRSLLETASLPERARDRSLAAFAALARAEATIHGTAPDEVHFHEVGAIDSIADTVGACVAFELLGIDRLVVSPVVVGHGTVETSHGTLPVPAPATAELLRGWPIDGGLDAAEMTTPTGAALVTTLGTPGPLPAMTVTAIGYGAGSRDTRTPNVARILVGAPAVADPEREQITVLATNLDHISPEHAAYAAGELLDAGARDVWQLPVTMKKGRAGVELRVLCAAGDEARFAGLISQLTGTLGVRIEPTARFVEPREHLEIETRYGVVRFKTGPAGAMRPEHDDVARIAREVGAAYDAVERALVQDANDAR